MHATIQLHVPQIDTNDTVFDRFATAELSVDDIAERFRQAVASFTGYQQADRDREAHDEDAMFKRGADVAGQGKVLRWEDDIAEGGVYRRRALTPPLRQTITNTSGFARHPSSANKVPLFRAESPSSSASPEPVDVEPQDRSSAPPRHLLDEIQDQYRLHDTDRTRYRSPTAPLGRFGEGSLKNRASLGFTRHHYNPYRRFVAGHRVTMVQSVSGADKGKWWPCITLE